MFSTKELKKVQKDLDVDDGKLTQVFDALRDKARLRIFLLLTQRDEVCVTDIANVFGVTLPAASRQLKILEQAGLVEKERHGQIICYMLKEKSNLVQLLKKFILGQVK